MKMLRFLLFVTLALANGLSAWGMQRVVQQSFALPANGTVLIDSYRGMITVTTGEGPEVKVRVLAVSQKENAAEARRALDGLQLRMEQTQDGVRVVATNPHETGVRIDIVELVKLELYFELVVPQTCNLNLTTLDGGINVESLSGNMRARTETGAIFFRQIDGNVVAEAKTGDVVVSRCSGSVDLKSIRGDVRIGTVGGRAVLETVNGDIEVMSAYNTITAKVADGDISAGFAQIAGPSFIRAAVGNVTAVLNPEDNFSIRAHSRWGKIVSELPVESVSGKIKRGRLVGDYKGGGPQIEIEAPGGSVRLKTGEPLFEQ